MVDCSKTINMFAVPRTAFELARTYSCSKLELEESLSGNCRLHLCCDAGTVLSIIYYLLSSRVWGWGCSWKCAPLNNNWSLLQIWSVWLLLTAHAWPFCLWHVKFSVKVWVTKVSVRMLLWWRLKIKILALAVSLCWLVAGGWWQLPCRGGGGVQCSQRKCLIIFGATMTSGWENDGVSRQNYTV